LIHKTDIRSHKFILLVTTLIIVITFFINPEFYIKTITETDYSDILMILVYLPGFILLMGLFEVLLPEKFVVKHLGKHSGVKGSVYNFLLGSLIPGPLYLAFPLAAVLLKKGVSRFNITIFIGAWASFKIVEEVFELQFLGPRFLLLRFLISIPFVIILAYIMGKIHLKELSHKTSSA